MRERRPKIIGWFHTVRNFQEATGCEYRSGSPSGSVHQLPSATVPIPDLSGDGDGPPSPSPICPNRGDHPHPRPTFAGDGGSSPSPAPMGPRALGPCTSSGAFSAPTGPPQLSAQLHEQTRPRPQTSPGRRHRLGRRAASWQTSLRPAPPNCGPSVDLGQMAPGESAMMQLRLPPRPLTPPPLPLRWLGALLFNSRARRRCRLSLRTGSRRARESAARALPPAAASAALAAARAALLRASERTRSRRRPASASRTAATVCTDSSGATAWALQEGTDSRVAASRGSLGIDVCSCRVPYEEATVVRSQRTRMAVRPESSPARGRGRAPAS
jgi:hypothetical protein